MYITPIDILYRREAMEFYAALHVWATERKCWRDTEAWLGRQDLFYLMVRLLRRPDINKDWLFDRCREVQAKPDFHLDLWAREHGKSSIITFGKTIQDILIDPEITVGIFSHTRPIAKAFLRQIKAEFETNEALKYVYPDVLFAEPWKESPSWSEEGIVVKRIGNPKEATVEAWGLVEGQPTGRHFTLMVYDDVVTRESVTTAEQIKKTTEAWELSDNLGVTAERGGRRRYIGTRYNLYDTYAVMMQRGSAIPRVYPATHNGRMDGDPVLFSDAEWKRRLRDYSRSTVASQLLQNPMADEGAMFMPAWLKGYDVRPRTMNVYIMCDPSRGRNVESDNTAMAVVGIAAGGAKFLLDGACHRMTLSQRWHMLKTLYRRWSVMRGINHIAVGYERYGMQSDDEYFQEQMELDKRRGVPNPYFQIEELNWPREGGNSKRERVERLEPDFRNGRFHIPYAVWRAGKPMIWSVGTDPATKDYQTISYRDVGGLSSAQMDVVDGGSPDLIAKAIRGVDSDGKIYDVTLHFIEEYTTFPFGRFKDLIDAVSRTYDMEPRAPTKIKTADTEPAIYWDS